MLFKKQLFWLLFLVVGLFASYYVVNSNVVLRWAINKVSTQLTEKIEIKNIQGGLVGPVILQDVRFISSDVRVNASKIKIDWNPISLLFDTIEVTSLDVSDIEIVLSGKTDINIANSNYIDHFDFRKILPLNIMSGTISNFSINKKINNKNEVEVIEKINFSAKKRNEKLIISKFNLTAPYYSLNAIGEVSSLQKLSIDGLVKWDWRKPDSQRYVGDVKLQGDSTLLNVDMSLKQPENFQFNGVLKNLDNSLTWHGSLIANNVDLTKILMTEDPGLKAIGPINGKLKLQGDLDNIIINQAVLSQINSNAKVQIQGEISLNESPLSFVGQTEWQNIQWSLPGKNTIFNTVGKVAGKISENNYDLTVSKVALQYNGMKIKNFSATVTGNYSAFELKNISATLFDGTVSGDAIFNLQSGLHWKNKLALKHINPAVINLKQLSMWPGDVSFNLTSRGNMTKNKVKAQIQFNEVRGLLREKQFTAFADVNISNNFYLINKMKIALGNTKIDSSGNVGKKWNLNWVVNRVDLGFLDSRITGEVSGSGSIIGARQSPIIKANMSASKINIDNQQRIDRLTLNMNVDLSDKKRSTVNVKAENIEYQNIQLDKLVLSADGKQLNHVINVTALLDAEQLELELQGAFNNKKNSEWQGEITKGSINSDSVGDWQLSPETRLEISKSRVELPELCWHNKKSNWCIDTQWRIGTSLDANLKLNDVPLSLFQGMVNKEFQLGGVIQGEAEIHALDSKITDAKISLNINQGYVDMVLNEDITRLSSFEFAKFKYKQKKNFITSELNLQFEEQEKLAAGIKLIAPNTNTEIKNWPLTGYLKSNTQHPDFIRMIYTAIDEIQGDWQSDIKLRGTLNKPVFTGYSKIKSSLISIPVAGIELKDVFLDINSVTENKFKIKGGFLSGKGTIKINGDLETNLDKGFPAELNVAGDNVQIFNTEEFNVEISTTLKLNKKAERINVKGTVKIPNAMIKAKSILSQSIKISDDVVFVNKHETSEEKILRKQSRWNFVSDINIILGDKVFFDGYGVSGRLTGNVDIKAEPGKLITGLGALHIQQGRYKFFSTVLDLDIGRLIYQNDPVFNPSINARATKRSGDITAGVRLTGFLKSPEVSVYSIPTMPENEAVSYLLFGKKVEDNSFGLSSLNPVSGQSGSDGVDLGNKTNPGSYINYAVGLLNSTSVLRIRFELNKNWELYTESSATHRGAEIIYTFER